MTVVLSEPPNVERIKLDNNLVNLHTLSSFDLSHGLLLCIFPFTFIVGFTNLPTSRSFFGWILHFAWVIFIDPFLGGKTIWVDNVHLLKLEEDTTSGF